MSDIDKVLVGRKYGASHRVSNSNFLLFLRDEPLTLRECQEISLNDLIKINAARHKARVYITIRPLAKIRSMVNDVLQSSPSSASNHKNRKFMSHSSTSLCSKSPVVSLPSEGFAPCPEALESPGIARIT